MAVFTLTENTDNFTGTGSDIDYFVGVPMTINSMFYDGTVGGSDTGNGGGGNDEFYLGDGALGTFDGGTETDTVHAYGVIDFFSTFTNFEILDVAATGDAIVNIAATDLNAFGTLTGVQRSDGRIHLELGLDANVDFGAKLDGMGIMVWIDASLSGSRSIEGTQHSDLFHIDLTHASSDISYFGDGGADIFESDNDGGLARFFGGADNDAFKVFRDGSFFGQFSEIDGGANTDTLISTSGDYTNRTVKNVEILRGTLNTLTAQQDEQFDTFESENDLTPQLSLKDTSFTVWFKDYSDKAPDGIALNTSAVAGGGEYTLSAKADVWRGNNLASEKVYGGGGNEDFVIQWSTGDGEDTVLGEGGNDQLHVTSFVALGETCEVTYNGGSGTLDEIVINIEDGTARITGIEMIDVEVMSILRNQVDDREVYAELATFARVLRYLDEPDATIGDNPVPGPRAAAGDEQSYISLAIEGAGGVLDMTTKAETLSAGAGVRLNGSAATSAVNFTGSTRNDTLTGSAFNDTLSGGSGIDQASGGLGSDTYVVNSAGDTVTEAAGQGTDTVQSAVNFTLGANFEKLTLTGSANRTATGNSAKNTLVGNTGNNRIWGEGGNDTASGGAGEDTLKGGSGNDSLNGGADDDTADYSDKSAKVTVVLDDAGDGTATIGTEVDALDSIQDIIGGSAGDSITAGDDANSLSGGAGKDTLKGGAGKDTLNGGADSDTASYADKSTKVTVVLNNNGDGTATIGSEVDTLDSIENLIGGSAGDSFTAGDDANSLSGGNGNDTMNGGAGADTLIGGTGSDSLTGGTQADVFRFSSALGASNVDTITDFAHDADVIQLDAGIFAAIGTALSSGEFYAADGATAAHDDSDHIIYNKTNGRLYYDRDSAGGAAAVHFATLSSKPTLDAGDFAVA